MVVFSDGIAYGEYSWSDILSLSVFADYGWGKLKDANGGPTDSIDIAGWGVETELTFPNIGGFARFLRLSRLMAQRQRMARILNTGLASV